MADFGRLSGPLITALAGGASVRAAAKATGLSERTIYRKLTRDDFRQEVAKARAELVNRAVAMLSGTASRAATALRKLLKSENENTRRQAAVNVIDALCKLRAGQDFDQRLALLEEIVLSGEKP